MTKTNYDISIQFRKDLMATYEKVGNKGMTQKQAYDLTVRHPAPRYYVTPKQARQILAKMFKGDFSEVAKMTENRRRLYASLFDTTVRLMKRRGYKDKTLNYVIQFAVLEPAPEFFVNWRAFQKIFQCVQDGRFVKSPKWYDDEGTVPGYEPQEKYIFKGRTYDRQKWKSNENDSNKKKRVSRSTTGSPKSGEGTGEENIHDEANIHPPLQEGDKEHN